MADTRAELQSRGIDPSGMSDTEVLDRGDREEDARRLAQPQGVDTQTPAEKRAELQQRGIDVQGLSDAQVVDRWERDYETRFLADLAKSRRDSEADVLSRLAQQDADEQRQRQDADLARQTTATREQLIQATQGARAAGDAALRSLGVDPDKLQSEDEDESDEAADEFGLKLYQQMIDNGIAPQCKGKQGDELIECVDAALGTDDDDN